MVTQISEINGFKCRYEVSGNLDSSETVLFLNGIASPIESWNGMVPYFSDNYKILRLDYRGQWHSEVTPPPYSFNSHADDINAFLEAMNVKKTHVIGTSLGGEIGMFLAIRHPSKVATLSVIASVSELDSILRYQVSRWRDTAAEAVNQIDTCTENPKELLENIGHNFLHNAIPEMYGDRFIKESLKTINERDKAFRETAHRNFYQGHVYLCEMFLKLENEEKLTGELHKIKCPSYIIAGGKDILKPPVYSEIIANNIPGAEYIVFPDAGHAVAVEKCDIIGDILSGFIRKNSNG